ncbi:hypothetical protein [Agaribacterium sp. ZY112]|uniref:hypothetical protein n=1 Tax=Agaribacterium sp. ZY112 TaxID=3233574 RepID=UPI003524C062
MKKNTTDQNLRQSIKEHSTEYSLNSQQLCELHCLLDKGKQNPKNSKHALIPHTVKTPTKMGYAKNPSHDETKSNAFSSITLFIVSPWVKGMIAACFTLLLVLALPNLNNSNSTIYKAIANEVIANHLKLKPLDIKTANFSEASQYFSLLSFKPSESTFVKDSSPKLQLLGGRYCSIKGVEASQFRYKTNTQGIATLYQVPYTDSSFGTIPNVEQPPIKLIEKGLKVSMWQENGLMMVLVETAP